MTIRKIDDHLKVRLRVRAAANGRSMEDEARNILRAALSASEQEPFNLAARIRARMAAVGGATLKIPPREQMREPPDFSG
jgi:plasmid stability protein